MRPAFILGRTFATHGACNSIRSLPGRPGFFRQLQSKYFNPSKGRPRNPSRTILLCATLSPAAFLKIGEEERHEDKTGEKVMLEASRAEIRKKLPNHKRGLSRVVGTIAFVFDQYIYEPIATGFRFLHLVVIFVPVLVTVPATWLGRRVKDRDNERSGTLWWYGFLVKSMERAGPAFIKV